MLVDCGSLCGVCCVVGRVSSFGCLLFDVCCVLCVVCSLSFVGCSLPCLLFV